MPEFVVINLYTPAFLITGDFETRPAVRPDPGRCHCLEQQKLPRTGWNHRSTTGWVLKPSLMVHSSFTTRHLPMFVFYNNFKRCQYFAHKVCSHVKRLVLPLCTIACLHIVFPSVSHPSQMLSKFLIQMPIDTHFLYNF